MLNVRCNDNSLFGFGFDSFMQTNIKEEENGYILNIDMPGVNKEDIKIDLDDDILTVSVKSNKKDENNTKYLHEEIEKDIDVSRSYQLKDIDIDNINAKYTDGVLTINALKKAQTLSKNILIE